MELFRLIVNNIPVDFKNYENPLAQVAGGFRSFNQKCATPFYLSFLMFNFTTSHGHNLFLLVACTLLPILCKLLHPEII